MSTFQLQQFAINQSRSGMKICSDSLLFGALIPIEGAKRVLDIGAGTGLLSLMQAQKLNALADLKLDSDSTLEIITAVELTHAAAEEAQQNFENSPWSQQLELIEQDIQSFAAKQQAAYDLIICNPPFFVEQTKTAADKPLRHAARHTDTLSFQDLIHSIDLLLSAAGKVFILLPIRALMDFCQQAAEQGFTLTQQIEIAESREHKAKVALLEFKRSDGRESDTTKRIQRLNKFQQPNVHSDAVQKLLQSFLLRYR
ncbi:MAG: methyltransferase [Oleispira sp.]|nr:methyltransferase [Oleispira sp.]MBL4881659.1 methyltransferase [Oleispira sp.]